MVEDLPELKSLSIIEEGLSELFCELEVDDMFKADYETYFRRYVGDKYHQKGVNGKGSVSSPKRSKMKRNSKLDGIR